MEKYTLHYYHVEHSSSKSGGMAHAKQATYIDSQVLQSYYVHYLMNTIMI